MSTSDSHTKALDLIGRLLEDSYLIQVKISSYSEYMDINVHEQLSASA